jgi:hypothetical protein
VKRLRRLRCRWSLKLTLGALLFFGLTPATHAAILDLSMMTCREFLAADKDELSWPGLTATTKTTRTRQYLIPTCWSPT